MCLPWLQSRKVPSCALLTLNNGQSFVLPLRALLGTSYTDGTPPDPFVPNSVFQTLDISFAIDGVTAVNAGHAADYLFGAVVILLHRHNLNDFVELPPKHFERIL